MPDFPTTRVDLLRHGEAVGGKKYRGRTDDPLSERGLQQMWDTVGEFRGWQRVITSPLSRCAAFACALHGKWRIPVVEDARLTELRFGAWEGKFPAELTARDPNRLNRFWRDPRRNRPPGAEKLADFARRVEAAWQNLTTDGQGQHLLVVAHAGVIRLIVSRALGMPLNNLFRIHVPNAALTRVTLQADDQDVFPSVSFPHGRL
ncbi:MAG: histidine phosphatase family protein [Burkholderiales bacterium]